MVFHWSLSDSKSPQVSKNLLNILNDLNNATAWMVSTRPLFSLSSCPCTKSFVDRTERTNYNWYHRHLHARFFFQFSSKVKVLNSLFAFFQFKKKQQFSKNSRISCSEGFLFFSFLFFFFFWWGLSWLQAVWPRLNDYFTQLLAGGFSLDFELKRVSLCQQDSSQYANWSQQCCDDFGFPLISNSFGFFSRLLMTVLSVPTTLGIVC